MLDIKSRGIPRHQVNAVLILHLRSCLVAARMSRNRLYVKYVPVADNKCCEKTQQVHNSHKQLYLLYYDFREEMYTTDELPSP